MRILKYILFSLLGVIFCSCQEVLDFDPGEINPYPVLISKPDSGDSVVCVYISRSRFFLDEDNYPSAIGDASVTLDVNGNTYVGVFDNNPASQNYNKYVFSVVPQPGDSMRVSAVVPGFDHTVSAATKMPVMPQVEVTDFVIDTNDCYFREWDSTWVRENYYYRIKFRIRSTLPKQFFSVMASMSNVLDENDTANFSWDTNEASFTYIFFECNDPVVNTSDIENLIDGEASSSFYGDNMAFSNEMFQSGEHEFTIEFSQWAGDSYGYNKLDYSKIPVRLFVRSLSRDLYLYTMTTQRQSEADLFFSEPVQVHCNIDGGIGIFGASSLRKLSLPAPRFEHFNHNNSDNYYYKKKKK
ncbi:MAG: DUF4249 domain-containing protein [Bacteroidales bacterium]|nr:DUF4249 domain-containing protein [Bacteroidales bacterium]